MCLCSRLSIPWPSDMGVIKGLLLSQRGRRICLTVLIKRRKEGGFTFPLYSSPSSLQQNQIHFFIHSADSSRLLHLPSPFQWGSIGFLRSRLLLFLLTSFSLFWKPHGFKVLFKLLIFNIMNNAVITLTSYIYFVTLCSFCFRRWGFLLLKSIKYL